MVPSLSTAPHPACLHRVQWGPLLRAWGCCLVTKNHYQLHLNDTFIASVLPVQRTVDLMPQGKRWAWVCDACCPVSWLSVPFDGSGGRCHTCKELVLMKRSLLPQFWGKSHLEQDTGKEEEAMMGIPCLGTGPEFRAGDKGRVWDGWTDGQAGDVQGKPRMGKGC